MTTEPIINIDPKIAAHVDAALAAGFTVHSLPTPTNRPAGWVAVCLDEDGPFAHIQKPTMAFDPVQLDVPVTPHKDYGSGVLVDHDGTPDDAVRALAQACAKWDVTVRFMTEHYYAKHGTPVARNQGRKCIDKWAGITKLGERGTNWQVRQLAGRLEIGDRFDSALETDTDHGILTVTGKRYGGTMYDFAFLTVAELPEPIQIRTNQFVTLVGAS